MAPWQLFFQQSYVIDKRITPRFVGYEKADPRIGIVIVVLGAAAVMGATVVAFAGTGGAGHFTDSAGLAHGIAAYAGRAVGAVFAVALLDASIMGAFAVSLSSAYAIGDVLGLNHSLHRGMRQAKGFYAVYALLVAVAATVVLIPGSPLGLLAEGCRSWPGCCCPARRCSCCCCATTGRCCSRRSAPGDRHDHGCLRGGLRGGGRPGECRR